MSEASNNASLTNIGNVKVVRLDQCGVPKCKGCGMHLNHEHAEGCLIVLSEAFKKVRKKG